MISSTSAREYSFRGSSFSSTPYSCFFCGAGDGANVFTGLFVIDDDAGTGAATTGAGGGGGAKVVRLYESTSVFGENTEGRFSIGGALVKLGCFGGSGFRNSGGGGNEVVVVATVGAVGGGAGNDDAASAGFDVALTISFGVCLVCT